MRFPKIWLLHTALMFTVLRPSVIVFYVDSPQQTNSMHTCLCVNLPFLGIYRFSAMNSNV